MSSSVSLMFLFMRSRSSSFLNSLSAVFWYFWVRSKYLPFGFWVAGWKDLFGFAFLLVFCFLAGDLRGALAGEVLGGVRGAFGGAGLGAGFPPNCWNRFSSLFLSCEEAGLGFLGGPCGVTTTVRWKTLVGGEVKGWGGGGLKLAVKLLLLGL